MAKVLKPGRVQRGWSREFVCTGDGNGGGGCKAVLLISEYDIYETASFALGEGEYYNTFCCPQCGVETDIPPRYFQGEPKGKKPTRGEIKAIADKNLRRK